MRSYTIVLYNNNNVVPIACESLGVFGAETLSFLKDLGHLCTKPLETHNPTSSYSSAFLWQSREEIPPPSWEH